MADPFGIDDPRGESVATRLEGNLFVPEGAALPPYCVSCAKPAHQYCRQTFVAFPPIDQLWLLLLGHLLFRRASLGVPLCPEHVSRHRTLTGAAVLACVLILPVTFWALFQFGPAGLVAGPVAFVIAFVIISRARSLQLKRVGEYECIYGGASEEFLEQVKMREPRGTHL